MQTEITTYPVSARLDAEQWRILRQLEKATGWTRSQVIRYLLDNAAVRPASVFVELPAKNVSRETSEG